MNFLLTILAIFISFFILSTFYINFKKKIINTYELIIIIILSISIFLFSLRPDSFDQFFFELSGYTSKEASVIIAILFLFLISLNNYIKIKIMNKKIIQLIRSESLKEAFKKLDEQ